MTFFSFFSPLTTGPHVSTDTDSCTQSRRLSDSSTPHPPFTTQHSSSATSRCHIAFPEIPSHQDRRIKSDAPQRSLHISCRSISHTGSVLHSPSPLNFSLRSLALYHHSTLCPISLTICRLSLHIDPPLEISRSAMAKLALLFALFVLPAIAVAARPTRHPLVVRGKVYCDPCRAGFETSASTFIAGNAVSPTRSSNSFLRFFYGVVRWWLVIGMSYGL